MNNESCGRQGTLGPGPDPAELYLARLGTDHSRATVTSALRTIHRLAGTDTIDWKAVTYADLAAVRAGLGRFSVAWANTCWTVLRQVVQEARRLGLVDERLVNDVCSLPRLRGTTGRLGRDVANHEVADLLDACDPDTVVGRRDAALVVLLATGGLRRSEAAAAGVADWDPVRCQLLVPCGKGRRPRVVPMPRWAGAYLDAWLDKHPGDGQLLRAVDRWGHVAAHLSVRSIHHLLARICDDAGIDRLSPHALRAHRITEVIDASDPLVAQRLAGHINLSTTSRYDRRAADHLASVVDAIGEPGTSSGPNPGGVTVTANQPAVPLLSRGEPSG